MSPIAPLRPKSPDQHRSYRPLFLIIFYFVLIALAVYYLYPNLGHYQRLFTLSPRLVLLMALTILIPEQGLQNYILYRALGASISLSEGLALGILNKFANQLPFAGGIVTKGVYLNRIYKLTYSRFIGATVGLLVLALFVSGLTGISALGYISLSQGSRAPWPLVTGFLLMSILIGVLWLPFPTQLVPARWQPLAKEARSSLQFWAKRIRVIVPLLLLQAVTILKVSFRLWAAFQMMSQDIPITYCLLFASASMLTQLVSIAPGGLGVRETIVVAVGHFIGLDVGVSIVALGIDRVIATAVIIISGLIITPLMGREFFGGQAADANSDIVAEVDTYMNTSEVQS